MLGVAWGPYVGAGRAVLAEVEVGGYVLGVLDVWAAEEIRTDKSR